MNKKIILVSHIFDAVGPAERNLIRYSLENGYDIAHIAHPFVFSKKYQTTVVNIYKKGLPGKTFCWFRIPKSTFFYYLRDFFLTIYYFLKYFRNCDVYVGVDCLNAFTGVILKKLGLIDNVIFYVIDYIPQKFNNKLLNYVYHAIDRVCCYNCNYIWDLSPNMINGRIQNGLSEKVLQKKTIVVPIDCDFKENEILPIETIDINNIVYFGGLKEEFGVEILLDALVNIKKIFPNVLLHIIGDGNLKDSLEEKSKDLLLDNNVKFYGFIESYSEVKSILLKCALGVAPYKNEGNGFKKYCDPSKVKFYLSCGLPIVMTNTTWFSEIILRENAGVITNYDKDDISKSIVSIIKDRISYSKLRNNAINLAKSMSSKNILDNAFKRSMHF